jgi:hypothetical protein
MEQILTVSTMAMLVLELVKYLVRFIMKDPNYNFSKMFYALTLPVLQVLVLPLLVFLGVAEGQPSLDLQYLVVVILETLASVLLYNTTIKKFKEYQPAKKIYKS